MNCTVCGSPLLFDRVVFHCSCGAFVHAYCWDEHVLQAHQPSFEIGSVNLDGEFIARESKVEEQVAVAEASEEQSPEEPSTEQQSAEEQSPEEPSPEEQSPEEQSPEEQSSEEQTTPLLE
jgi:hypothetical protein